LNNYSILKTGPGLSSPRALCVSNVRVDRLGRSSSGELGRPLLPSRLLNHCSLIEEFGLSSHSLWEHSRILIQSRIRALTVLASSSAPRRTVVYACVASSSPPCDHLECNSVCGTRTPGRFGNSIPCVSETKTASAPSRLCVKHFFTHFIFSFTLLPFVKYNVHRLFLNAHGPKSPDQVRGRFWRS